MRKFSRHARQIEMCRDDFAYPNKPQKKACTSTFHVIFGLPFLISTQLFVTSQAKHSKRICRIRYEPFDENRQRNHECSCEEKAVCNGNAQVHAVISCELVQHIDPCKCSLNHHHHHRRLQSQDCAPCFFQVHFCSNNGSCCFLIAGLTSKDA